MKKFFTLAAAVLVSFSLWAAEETFSFEWSAAGTKGFSYSQAGPAGGAMLTDNALYLVSNEGPKVDGDNLNPYRVGFIFKPAADVTLKIKGAAGSSDRTLQNIKIDKEVDARLYNLCKDAVGSNATVMQYALDNASDEDKEFYTTVGILKKSSGKYVVAGDAKSVSGQTAQAKLYAERVNANNIKFAKNSEAEEMLTIGNPAEDFTFEAGKSYRIYTEVSSSTGAKLLSFTFVTAASDPVTDPVSKVTVAGKDACYLGETVSLTATPDVKANAYKWSVNGEEQEGATNATFEFKAAAAGSFDIVCSAKNDNNSDWIASDAHKVVVTEKEDEGGEGGEEGGEGGEEGGDTPEVVEGLLIKGTTQQEVSGPAAGSIETNLSKKSAVKLDAEKYFGLALKEGFELQEGDEFIIHLTAAADLGKCMLYADKEGKELIFDEGVEYSKEAPSVTGEKRIKLPAAAAGKKAIFLYRGKKNEGPQWNPTFDYISVERGGSSEAIENTEAGVKATKVIRNGQMFIEMNGVVYTLQGAIVK